jgi:molybdopterin converting factor small subunit
MKVTFQFEAQLRQVAGVNSFDVELPENVSLLTAIQHVSEEAGEALRERLLTAEKSVQPGIMLFVNELPVPSALTDNHRLDSGDVILLLPPISGG